MIKLIDNLPDNVIGFEAVGEVDARDYKSTLDPAVDAALENNDKLRLVYVLGKDFDGYSGGAMWEDTKLGVSHWGAWEKIALVTNKDWVDDAIKFMGWMVPGEIQVYPTEEVDAAKAWASE